MKTCYLLLIPFLLHSPTSAAPYLAQGTLAGEVTSSSVFLQTRLTALPGPELDESGNLPGMAGVVRFEYGSGADLGDAKPTPWLRAEPDGDFIVRAFVSDLTPGQTYFYRAVYGPNETETSAGSICSFKTLPSEASTAPVSFIMGSCQNYAFFMNGKKGDGRGSAAPEDKALGYPAYAAMKTLAPDFFVGTGDIVYYDHPAKTAATTLPELRKKWHEQARLPRLIEFFAKTPAYWSKDDHDFRFNDADLGGTKQPEPSTGIEIFREQMPILAAGDRSSPTYRTHRINRHLQLWFSEGRDYRSPNKMKDGPDKTLWGQEQRKWLMRTLQQSDATFKILISPTPMVGPDDAYKTDNHVNLGGFRHEADTFFGWVKTQGIANFFTFCGDRHWQYHSIHPSGVEEFACGALNDENSRVGVLPGSKKGTDPDSLIRQPYTYEEPTGGFLHVRLDEQAGLAIDFHDDEGRVLHSVKKQP